jgi:hypothetical protein
MTRTLIGLDSTGVACVKITKGTFDPVTTSDSLRERFYFNSKWTNQMETPEIEPLNYVPYSGSSERVVRFPTGSTNATFSMMRRDGPGSTGYSVYYVRGPVRYPLIRYDMPVFEILPILRSNGRYRSTFMVERQFGAAYGDAGVYGGYTGTPRRGEWKRRQEAFDNVTGFNLDYGLSYETSALSSSDQDSGYDGTLIVYNLPGTNIPLDGPTSPPSPVGKKTVQITSTQCRVAKPGYDVTTATPAQMAFDATGRPLNVIAADDIAIPTGTSFYSVGITLPDNTAIDLSCYNGGSSIYYPMRLSSNNAGYGVEYWVDGNLIRFNNTRTACRARFIVYGSDPLGPSSGTNKVLRQFTDGSENVVQMLRPGAAATPRFSDIIVDSRRPVIQILASGYFSVPTANGFAVDVTNVTYDATGFFPYMKYMTVHGTGLNQEVRFPRVNRRFQNSLSNGGLAGDGSYCLYNTTGATFYTAKGSPNYTFYRSSGGGEIVDVNDPTPMVGIRWFVLGIPN